MLTDQECELMAVAFELRDSEVDDTLWLGVTLDAFSTAAGLHQKHMLERTWREGEPVFRASDQAILARAISQLRRQPTGAELN
jgi:hypothetical protein